MKSAEAAILPPSSRSPDVRAVHPVRSMAFSVLRFASVLIGAGLLLRTASAEYVISAPQGAAPRPENREPAARPLAHLALPKPSFGQPAAEHERIAQAGLAGGAALPTVKHASAKRDPAPLAALAVLSAPIAETTSGKPAAANTTRVSDGVADAPAKPAERPAAEAPRVVAKPEVQASALRPPVAAAGLLAPVRIVSGRSAPVPVAPTPPVAAPAPTQAVQISLAPPVMRPGPRTTVLTTDVHAEMRRPASAWDYAEALPPELRGRPAAAPRQASAQPVAPSVKLAMPASSAVAETKAAPAPIVRETAVASDPAKPVRLPDAKVAASRKTAALQDIRTVPAKPAGIMRKAQDAPRVLALLDRPSAAAAPAGGLAGQAVLAPSPAKSHLRGVPSAALAAPAPARLFVDKRRHHLRHSRVADPVAEPRQGVDDTMTALVAKATPPVVSLDQRGAATEAVLADASLSETSLRDRIPRPAF